ncbi:hypothetical protein ANO14919_116570 [Xylariales sp. No.14919]|nr:hypothetical protein ANO14919_116570 [Xylariales sp. No.14919]
MPNHPSATELASRFRGLDRRHGRLAATYDQAKARYDAVTNHLHAKRHALAEETRLSRHPLTRQSCISSLRRDVQALEENQRTLKSATDQAARPLKRCEKDMRAWVKYVQNCRALGYRQFHPFAVRVIEN